ncbi:MAG: hypothetical protein FWC64_02480 [Treponema sp.]|nr:hypothetical protein [Treponema sp.]
MKKRIAIAATVALCLALFAACPNRITFPPPQIEIFIDGPADHVTRGGSLPLRAQVRNLEGVFKTNTIEWMIVEHERDDAINGVAERETFIEHTPGYHTSRLVVDRYESPAYSTFTVRARLAELPGLYGTVSVVVSDPVSVVSAIQITSHTPSVHRNATTGPLTARIDWENDLPPLRGDSGVFFRIASGGSPGTIASPVPGEELQGSILVGPNQEWGSDVLTVQAVSHYDNSKVSPAFPINVLTPVVQAITIIPAARVIEDGGLFRDEYNLFTAEVTGLGNPPNDIVWSASTLAEVEFNPDVPGELAIGANAPTSVAVAVTAAAAPQFGSAYATSSFPILHPVITEVVISGPDRVERGQTETFTAVANGRGNPSAADMAHIYWSIPTPGTNHQTRVTPGWGGAGGTLTVSANEFLGKIRVRATSGVSPKTLANHYVDIDGAISTDGWRAVSVGEYHVLALTADHRLFSWGRRTGGILGQGQAAGADLTSPQRIATPAHNWRMVSAGSSHNIAITDDNRLFGWGSNSEGQLGRPPTSAAEAIPGNIVGAVGHFWINADAGPRHTVGVKEMGTLYTFGANEATLIGRQHVNQEGAGLDGEDRPHWQPGRVQVLGLPDYGWRIASAGTDHSAAIRVDGSLWVWGRNEWGQLGLGRGNSGLSTRPVRIHHPQAARGTRWESVNAGDRFTIAIDSAGQLWVWGRNELGQLGQSSPLHEEAPVTPYQGQGAGNRWNYINSMTNHSVVMSREGRLFVFGSNALGQFGNGFAVADHVPGIMMVSVMEDRSFLFANVGGRSSMAVDASGMLYAWGDNEFHQLGLGTRRMGKDALPPSLNLPEEVNVDRYFEPTPQQVGLPPAN